MNLYSHLFQIVHSNHSTSLQQRPKGVLRLRTLKYSAAMKRVVAKVAVVGCGISGSVCASSLARNGVSVTVFDSGRGPGGRMSQRREVTEDGKELLFDHGAPYFVVRNSEVMGLVQEWEARALVTEWKEDFGSFDCGTKKFVDVEKDGVSKKYVGLPGMNSMCKAVCRENGVETKFGTTVGKFDWLEDKKSWHLIDMDGQALGQFDGVVASDKNVVSPRFTSLTGRTPPLGMTLAPELALKLQEVSAAPCFVLMLAFAEPLSLIPVKGFSFKNSEVLSRAFCDSSKPGRSATCECWVLHSTAEYARHIIGQYGLQKPSTSLLSKVAEELLKEFQSTDLNIPHPFFMKAHRWGSAFPVTAIAKEEEKCLWDGSKRLAVCGDFCVSPDVEGAVLSGMTAAKKLLDIFSCL